MDQTEQELVDRVIATDDHQAFAQLVQTYQSPLRVWFRQLCHGDEGRADDLAQETFIAAYSSIRKYRRESRFSTWLFGIGYNCFRTELKRLSTRIHDTDSSFDVTAVAQAQSSHPEMKLDLIESLAILTPEQRAVVTAFYQQGFTHEETARILQCPVGTVKTHLRVATDKLRDWFQSQ